MNANVTAVAGLSGAGQARRHRSRMLVGYIVAIAMLVALAIYGFDYYTLDSAQRPLSPKYQLLKPSGTIGLKLGMVGTAMFCAIFLYALRKRWGWLARQGTSKHWLDVSFKFRGIAGMAFWIMAAVALSGVVGRYLYAQIPRSLSTAEMSLKESQEFQAQLTQQLAMQRVISPRHLDPLFRLPSPETVQRLSIVAALTYMFALDLARPLHVARLRMRAVGFFKSLVIFGGLLPSGNAEIERVIHLAREQAALSKRILFLSRSQQVFHLWHVVHRPFSYSFAVLALIHISVVLLLGYM